MQDSTKTQSEKLLNEVRELIGNTEDLIETAASKGKEEAHAFKERLQARLMETKKHLQNAEENVAQRAKVACKVSDQYVHENPYKAIGIAAAIAFLLGLLVSRR